MSITKALSPNPAVDLEQLKLLINTIPQLIWIATAEGEVIYYNNRFSGYTQDANNDGIFNWTALIHEDDLEKTVQVWTHAVAAMEVYHHQHRLLMNDGTYRWHISRAVPYDIDGIPYWYGSATDIHENVEAMDRLADKEKKLRQARETLQLALSAGRIGIWNGNVKDGVIRWDPVMECIHGLAEGSFGGNYASWRALVHPDDFDRVEKEYVEQIQHSDICEVTYRVCRPDGGITWVLSKVKVYYDEQGNMESTFGVNVDITSQREQQEKLEEAKRQLQYQKQLLETVTQNTTLGLFMMDEQQHCIYMNEAAEKMTGYALSELQGKQVHYYIHHKKADGSFYPLEECPIDKALPDNQPKQGEETFVRRDGTLFPVAFTASPIVINGTPIGTVLEVRETTEEKLRSEALEKSEESLRTLVSTLPQLVWMIDRETDTGFLSEQWYTYTGETNITTENWSKVVHPDDFPVLMEIWQRCNARGISYRAEARLRNKDGEYNWFFVHGEPIRNSEGKLIKWIGAFTNIHAQKTITEKLEWMVESRTRQLTESQRILEQKNEQLLQANKELESMNYIASHDLQEPLRKIQTFASMLLTRELDEQKTRDYLEKMQMSANRMSVLIHDVMEYKKLTYSDSNLEPVDLNEIIVHVMVDLELMIQETGAELEFEMLPVVRAIPLQMHQLFSNLLCNAIKFNKGKPKIKVCFENMKGQELPAFPNRDESWKYCVIKVADNGIGFDPEHSERIFTLFQRLHNKQEFDGTGMGLAICKRIMENHLGHIYASSVKGRGSVFTLILPY